MKLAVGRLVAELGRAGYSPRQRGDGRWTALCPTHADGTPSLCIAQGQKGAVLKCMAGCRTEDILDALGLSWTDLFDEPCVARRRHARRRSWR